MTTINYTKSKCTTPFTIGKLDITSGQRSSLFVFNIAILLVNIMANGAAIFALVKSQPLRRRPAIVLIFYLCLSDLSSALISQTLFSIKMFNPELPCIYDLTFEFSSSVLGNLSLCIVVLISISRYLHTRYMMQVRSIITKARVRMSVSCSFGVAMVFSSVAAFGSSYGDIGIYIQTQTFVTALGVAMILCVVAIYRKTEIIARKRKAASRYEMRYTCYSEKVLKKIMVSTAATLLPLRLPFFASTVFKSVVTEIYKQRLTWWMQYTHLASYEILCLSSGANALIFLYNNSFARRFIMGTVCHWLSYLLCTSSHARATVEPIEGEIISPGIAPVVTTGWYDQYIPTTAPTTLSTAVVGKKVSKEQIKQRRAKRKKQKEKVKTKQKSEEEKRRIEVKEKMQNQNNNKKINIKCPSWFANLRKYEIHWKKNKPEVYPEPETPKPQVLVNKYTRQNLRLKMNLGFPRSTRVSEMLQQNTRNIRNENNKPSGSNLKKKEMGSTQELVNALNAMSGYKSQNTVEYVA